nr:YlxM family DNA-binding protein [Lachnoclostridium sp. An138]
MSMEKILEQTLLYDFYGELLTDHQKQVYEDVVLNDYSLSEVAEERGISRQGVHDLVKRCNRILQDYESKLHLVEKFVTIKEQIERMEASLLEAEQPDREELVRQLNRILENL